MSEVELLSGKGWTERAEPCACGTVLVASTLDYTEVVAAHVGSARHLAWRAWRETV